MVLSSLGHVGGENDDGDNDDGDVEDKKEMVEIVMRERGVCCNPTGPTWEPLGGELSCASAGLGTFDVSAKPAWNMACFCFYITSEIRGK